MEEGGKVRGYFCGQKSPGIMRCYHTPDPIVSDHTKRSLALVNDSRGNDTNRIRQKQIELTESDENLPLRQRKASLT